MAKKQKKPWNQRKVLGHTHERDRAKELGFSIEALRSWRRQGIGQAWVKLGREVFYIDADEPRWLASLKKTPPRSGRGRAA